MIQYVGRVVAFKISGEQRFVDIILETFHYQYQIGMDLQIGFIKKWISMFKGEIWG